MARNRTSTKLLLVHCAATTRHMDIGARTIHKWHIERGIFSERGLTGYHFIIRRSGLVEVGRDLREIGAHALGYNDKSVGVCLVGGVNKDLEPENNFTADQFESLEKIETHLKQIWPSLVTAPHNLVNSAKACPSFNVYDWQAKHMNTTDELRAKETLEAWEHDK